MFRPALAHITLRRVLIAGTLASACLLQGCATTLETFGLGVGVGVIGAVSTIACAIGCH